MRSVPGLLRPSAAPVIGCWTTGPAGSRRNEAWSQAGDQDSIAGAKQSVTDCPGLQPLFAAATSGRIRVFPDVGGAREGAVNRAASGNATARPGPAEARSTARELFEGQRHYLDGVRQPGQSLGRA